MTGGTEIRIGTRGSELARRQTDRVAGLIDERLGRRCRPVVITTRGDRTPNATLYKMEGKGFFTRELQDALRAGEVDIVVHSLKDLPTEEPDGLRIAAIPERADPLDVLLARPGVARPTAADPLGLPAGTVLGTSSLRRAAQALAINPQIAVRPLRGNVPTRVARLREGRFDAILLAAAGIDRLALDLDGLHRVDLPAEVLLPAPGQGALAVEARDDDPLADELAPIDDPVVARCVGGERLLLRLLGGGCHLPLGCLADERDGGFRLEAVLGEVDEAVTRATVARVAARAPNPESAAHACFDALRRAATREGRS